MSEDINNKQKFNFLEFYKKNKNKVFTIIFALILSIIIFIVLNEFKKKQNIEISKKYNSAKILIENNDNQKALKILENIISKNNSFYSPSSLNLIIDNNLIENKIKILTYFDEIISNTKLDPETKNLFIFKKIIFIGDDIKENELITNLKPILRSNSLLKNQVSDYIKKYYLSKGEFKKAKEFEIPQN